VLADAVDFLVSNDRPLLRKARRLPIADRVLPPSQAAATLHALARDVSAPPPFVRSGLAHEVDPADPIFCSLREDYPEFDEWFARCRRQHRRVWFIEHERRYGGLAIVKEEGDRQHDLPGQLLKLCTFKIAEEARGYRFGELLLKPVFAYAFDNALDYIYVEIFEKHADLVDLLEQFGFRPTPSRTERGELVLVKALRYSPADFEGLDALDFHVRFGPRHVKADEAFVVPIRPTYHRMLFPEHAKQGELFDGVTVFGNSLLKAYLSHARTRRLQPGSLLLFYESGGRSVVRSLGVVEAVERSRDVDTIARFVGARTVYPLSEIQAMCSKPLVAILFRQAAGALSSPLSLDELRQAGVLQGPPQSITHVKAEGVAWIRERLRLGR
jgi:hypothetical protein